MREEDFAPTFQVVPVGDVQGRLRDHIRTCFQEQFGHIRYVWAAPEHYVIAQAGGELAGMLALFPREIWAGSESVKVGGVGGVTTKREWRGRRIATGMLLAAEDFIRARLNAEFGFLLCRSEVAPVYAKLRWEHVVGPTTFQQPGGPHIYPHDTMVLQCSDRKWPEGAINMCGYPW